MAYNQGLGSTVPLKRTAVLLQLLGHPHVNRQVVVENTKPGDKTFKIQGEGTDP